MEEQQKVKDEDADFGIVDYDELQLEFHKDVMVLLKSEKHQEISADDCMIVFGRVYAVYVMSRLKQLKKLKYV